MKRIRRNDKSHEGTFEITIAIENYQGLSETRGNLPSFLGIQRNPDFPSQGIPEIRRLDLQAASGRVAFPIIPSSSEETIRNTETAK